MLHLALRSKIIHSPKQSLTLDITQKTTKTQNFTVPTGAARYIRFAWVPGTPYLDAMSFNSCAYDSDNDGVLDDSDNDSDNDGIPDVDEGND